jgi:hypothetical protein
MSERGFLVFSGFITGVSVVQTGIAYPSFGYLVNEIPKYARKRNRRNCL